MGETVTHQCFLRDWTTPMIYATAESQMWNCMK